jgi:hypothetical protein
MRLVMNRDRSNGMSKDFPFVRDHRVEAPQQRAEVLEHGLLVVVVPHEALLESEGVVLEIADADEEGDRPRSPGEAGRLDVHEGRRARVEIDQLVVAGRQRDVFGHRVEHRAQAQTAVLEIEREPAIHAEEAVLLRPVDLTRHHAMDFEFACRPLLLYLLQPRLPLASGHDAPVGEQLPQLVLHVRHGRYCTRKCAESGTMGRSAFPSSSGRSILARICWRAGIMRFLAAVGLVLLAGACQAEKATLVFPPDLARLDAVQREDLDSRGGSQGISSCTPSKRQSPSSSSAWTAPASRHASKPVTTVRSRSGWRMPGRRNGQPH